MRIQTVVTLSLCLACLASTSVMATPPSALKQQMPPTTFKAAGLNKLSPAELHTLEHWLREHPLSARVGHAPTAADMGAADLARRDGAQTEPRQIQSKVVGHFNGWRHGTVISLANGQQWQVSDDSTLVAPGVGHPVATVKHAFLGSYLLTVEGYNAAARVKRIR